MQVLLENGTVGQFVRVIKSEVIIKEPSGGLEGNYIVTITLNDENGNIIEKTGKVLEILED